MTSQPGLQTMAIHTLSNISRSKGNQTMKFNQLIEHNMRNHTQNVLEKLFPDPYLKNQNLACLWINSVKFQKVCFYCLLI